MPLLRSAKKALRSSARKRVFNLRRKKAMEDNVKAFRKLVAAGKADQARELLPSLYRAIDKAAKRGVIKKNTAARKKSRLSALLSRAS